MNKLFILLILSFILKSEERKIETDSVEDVREIINNNEKNILNLKNNISRLERKIQAFVTTPENITEKSPGNITEQSPENITEIFENITESSENLFENKTEIFENITESYENVTEIFIDLDSLNMTDFSEYRDILDSFNISHYFEPMKEDSNIEQTTENITKNTTELLQNITEQSTENITEQTTENTIEQSTENVREILFKIFIIMFALTASPLGIMTLIFGIMKIHEFFSKRSYNFNDIPI